MWGHRTPCNAILPREARMKETFIRAALWRVPEMIQRPQEPMWWTRCTGGHDDALLSYHRKEIIVVVLYSDFDACLLSVVDV